MSDAPNPEDGGVSLETLRIQYKWFTEALTKSIRLGVLSIIAALWALLTADKISLNATAPFGFDTNVLGHGVFLFAGTAILLDFLQYISTVWMTSIGIDRYEISLGEDENADFSYDEEHLGCWGITLYSVSTWFFVLKMLAAFLCFMSFIVLTFAIDLFPVTNIPQ